MRIQVYSIDDLKTEIDRITKKSFHYVTGDLVRFVRADIPKQKENLTFDVTVFITFVETVNSQVEGRVDQHLYECAIEYGTSLQKSNPKWDDPDQPMQVREKQLQDLKSFLEENGYSLLPGRIELY